MVTNKRSLLLFGGAALPSLNADTSALAVLSDRSRAAEDSYLRLAAYDSVPQSAAESLLAFWRHKAGTPLSEIAAE